MSNETEEPPAPTDSKQSSANLLDSLWGSSVPATERVWSLWDSVKKNPTVQQAQQQAQQVWKNYDNETVRNKLAELGRSATTYIDEADRKLEALENEAVSFIHDRSSAIIDRVKEVAHGEIGDGEVLYSGPERTPLSRLDAEILSLSSSPEKILAAEAASNTQPLSETEQEELLSKYPDLEATYKSLVPSKTSEDQFWLKYVTLKRKLEEDDRRRKEALQRSKKEQEDDNDHDDWGSSEEDEPEDKPVTANSKLTTTATTKAVAAGGSSSNADATSDSDWE